MQLGKSKKHKTKIKTDKKSRLEIKSRSKIIIPETTPMKTELVSEDSPLYDKLLYKFPEEEEESMF